MVPGFVLLLNATVPLTPMKIERFRPNLACSVGKFQQQKL